MSCLWDQENGSSRNSAARHRPGSQWVQTLGDHDFPLEESDQVDAGKDDTWAGLFSDDHLGPCTSAGRADTTARRLARLWAAVFTLGLAPKRWVTLEVVGRRSGRCVRFPLGMADWHGDWYLVAMLGEECNWVQNVRAANGQATLRHRRVVACHLVEVPAGERPPIIKRYLEKVPGARPHIPVNRHAPASDFEAISSHYPVFRIVPVISPRSTPSSCAKREPMSSDDTQ